MFVAGFIGSPRMNFLRGTANEERAGARRRAGAPAEVRRGAAKCRSGIRPEHLVVGGGEGADSRSTSTSSKILAALRTSTARRRRAKTWSSRRAITCRARVGEKVAVGTSPARRWRSRRQVSAFAASGRWLTCSSGTTPRPANGPKPCRSATAGSARWSSVASQRERLQINEDTLWTGGPYSPGESGSLAASR